jgi:hypothetical protein
MRTENGINAEKMLRNDGKKKKPVPCKMQSKKNKKGKSVGTIYSQGTFDR